MVWQQRTVSVLSIDNANVIQVAAERLSIPFDPHGDLGSTFCSWCHMTVDEFIERLESLKTVQGVDGRTPVAATVVVDDNEEFELAIAEVQNVEFHPTGPWAASENPAKNTHRIVRIV
ncbi:hypothetical protein [Rosistilla oblonga]|uniref:hypothetical protein n=1 Tax=Rosistilla oblonga TaxID=2527990 RepID=UPI003A969A94